MFGGFEGFFLGGFRSFWSFRGDIILEFYVCFWLGLVLLGELEG